MKLLTMAHASQRRFIEILRVIEEADNPIGARAISDSLSNRGYDLGERAVRYNLKILDELGFTKKQGYSGRVLTTLGKRELNDALVDDRIGFVNTLIEEYMYKTTFDPESHQGDVIVNASLVNKAELEAVLAVLGRAFDAGLTISNRLMIADEGEEIAAFEIPAGYIGLATVCSITLDGMLMKRGIPVNTSFAGLARINSGSAEFTDLIAYAGSSLDPIRVFMARKRTRVMDVIEGKAGDVLANVREIPPAAASLAKRLLDQTRAAGFGGMIEFGKPGEPILGCPVAAGKIGIAMCAGVNGVVAAEEMGIRIESIPISGLLDYSKMRGLRSIDSA
jgi:repressor of nif and glnA expression